MVSSTTFIVTCIILVVVTAILAAYLTKLYIKNKIENTLAGMIPDESIDSINKKMCGGVNFLEYPVPAWDGEGLDHESCSYDSDLSRFLLILCENVGTTNCPGKDDILLPDGFEIIAILKIPGSDIKYGYMFYNSQYKAIFLIWAGTSNAKMFEVDGNFIPVVMPSDITTDEKVRVHRGFLNIYEKYRTGILDAIQSVIAKGLPIDYFVIAGHSLGGGLTSISAFDLVKNSHVGTASTFAYTFGSPRAGNTHFADAYNDLSPSDNLCSMRVFNTEDIVPTVPPSAPKVHYTHVGSLVPFTLNLGSVVDNHIQAYFKYTHFI